MKFRLRIKRIESLKSEREALLLEEKNYEPAPIPAPSPLNKPLSLLSGEALIDATMYFVLDIMPMATTVALHDFAPIHAWFDRLSDVQQHQVLAFYGGYLKTHGLLLEEIKSHGTTPRYRYVLDHLSPAVSR